MSAGDVTLAAASAVGFGQMLALTVLYGTRSDWRSHPVGIVLLGSFTIKAVMFGMILIGRVIGPLGVMSWAIAIIIFDVVQFAWLWQVIRAQRAEMDDPSSHTEEKVRP